MQKEVFTGRYVRLITEERDGRVLEQVHIRSGVTVIPITSAGLLRFVLEKEWVTGEFRTKLVSGYMENDEEPLQCAKRELREELGLSGARWDLLQKSETRGTVCRTQYYFVVRNLKSGVAQPDSDEDIVGFEDIHPGEVRTRVLAGDFGTTGSAFALLKLLNMLLPQR